MATNTDDLQLVQRSTEASSPTQPSSPLQAQPGSEAGESRLPQATVRVKRFFLGLPILSIIVGGALLLAEVIIITLVLAAPDVVGIVEDVQLTNAQRGVLGAVSVVMVVEAFLLGTIDTGSEHRRAQLTKLRRNLAIQHLNKLRSAVGSEHVDTSGPPPDSALSLQQLSSLLVDQFNIAQYSTVHLSPAQLRAELKATKEEVQQLQQEVNHHTLQYIAALIFDLASFLWKWALALLVISNNWVSVGVAIAGGVVYPVVVFWKKSLNPNN